MLNDPVVPAAVQFKVKSGLNDFVSCDEMEFFHAAENPLDEQLITVFTGILQCAGKVFAEQYLSRSGKEIQDTVISGIQCARILGR